jgi:hypothetical protein
VIAFATAIAETESFDRYTQPGIRLAAEPDSEVFAYAAVGSLSRSSNILLDAAAARDDLEALVLVHPHAQIDDPELCAKARAALADPSVAVVGAVGSVGATGLAWWQGRVSAGAVTHRYVEHGGGELPVLPWAPRDVPFGLVETVDGFLLVLSPWAVRNVRFDETLPNSYGHDVDYCLQVREQGRTVVTADLRAIHHRELELIPTVDLWIQAHMQLAAKWAGRVDDQPAGEAAWKERARRAEAEREAARAMTHAHTLTADARLQELERRLRDVTATRSWRFTEPLRRANLLRHRAAERRRRA